MLPAKVKPLRSHGLVAICTLEAKGPGPKLCIRKHATLTCIKDLRLKQHYARAHGSTVISLGILLCLLQFKSLRLRPSTPEAYGKTADFGTLCIPGSSQRLDPSAALLSSSDRSRLAALNVMLTPCPVP